MKLFSKRHPRFQNRRFVRYPSSRERSDEGLFLSDALRTRLQQEIKYLVNSNDYLEPFLVVRDEFELKGENRKESYLRQEALNNISMRELGYNFSEVFDATTFSFSGSSYSDSKLMDLVEVILIFSKADKRNDLEERILSIFEDEQDDFTLHGGMVIEKGLQGLESVVSFIKEKNLQEKINSYFLSNRSLGKPNWEVLARTSADILQLLMSSPKNKKGTKKYAEELCKKVAAQWTLKEKIASLAILIDDTIKNAKLLSNEIANVRHTDRSTIPIDRPDFYKLIAMKNISLAEIIVLSLPNDYLSRSDLEEIKGAYLKKYQIDPNQLWLTPRTRQEESELKIEDLPF